MVTSLSKDSLVLLTLVWDWPRVVILNTDETPWIMPVFRAYELATTSLTARNSWKQQYLVLSGKKRQLTFSFMGKIRASPELTVS
jgi:hypothetical protein